MRSDDQKAADYYLLAWEKSRETVGASNRSYWLVKYLWNKGDKELAAEIAQRSRRVYSYIGLEAYEWWLEQEGRWTEALQTCADIEERYPNHNAPVESLAVWIRWHRAQPEAAAKAGYGEKIKAVFPGGLVTVSDAEDFSAPPSAGAELTNESDLSKSFGLRKSMVIVALDGVRVDTLHQFQVIREVAKEEPLTLIVWNGATYQKIKIADPPKRRLFGVDIKDYRR